jgi:uncharacterized protein (TIGR02594 family)
MKTLPDKYSWLSAEGAPRMLVEMLKIYGTLEEPGSRDNPVILGWAKEVGLKDIYKHDNTAWCGLAMAVVAKRADKPVVASPLWALNWRQFGTSVPAPMLGDVMVKPRYDSNKKLIGGHVTLYVGQDQTHYHCLGGNQNDSVNITRYSKQDNWTYRRTVWKIEQPPNVRAVFLSSQGAITGGSMA